MYARLRTATTAFGRRYLSTKTIACTIEAPQGYKTVVHKGLRNYEKIKYRRLGDFEGILNTNSKSPEMNLIQDGYEDHAWIASSVGETEATWIRDKSLYFDFFIKGNELRLAIQRSEGDDNAVRYVNFQKVKIPSLVFNVRFQILDAIVSNEVKSDVDILVHAANAFVGSIVRKSKA